MSTMDDLVEWLRTQLDEEAHIASLIPGGGYQPALWTAHRGMSEGYVEGSLAEIREHSGPVGGPRDETSITGYVAWGRNEDKHIVRWCPDRVLREVKSKRLIIDEMEATLRQSEKYGTDMGIGLAETTLALLALPYAGRPGYREEWRPAGA